MNVNTNHLITIEATQEEFEDLADAAHDSVFDEDRYNIECATHNQYKIIVLLLRHLNAQKKARK